MAKEINIKQVGADGSDMMIFLTDEEGEEFEIRLNIGEIGALMSMIDKAGQFITKQPPNRASENMLPMTNLAFGETGEYQIVRVYFSDDLSQDYAVPRDTPTGQYLKGLSEFAATLGEHVVIEERGPGTLQ